MSLLDLLLLRSKPKQAWQLPDAPTHWKRMHEGLGPLRRWGVPLLGMAALAAALWSGAWWLKLAVDPMRLMRQAPDALQSLQPWLGGQAVQVPAGRGVWAWQQGGVHLVAMRAKADGPARVIDLCERRTGAKHSPDSIYPLTVVGDLRAMEGDRRIARTPLVVPAALASGMPLLSVVGRAPDRLEDMDLRLQLNPPDGSAPGSWQVAMAHPRVPGTNGDYRLGQEAWLLWGGAVNSQASSKVDLPPSAGPIRHSRAIRIRWQSQDGCAAGALQWQLFDADGVAPTAEREPAVLWVSRASERPGNARVLRLSLASGGHIVPQGKALPLEDEVLFTAALRAGLITPLPGQRLAVAPSDMLRAEGLASTAATSEADSPVADRKSLLKALYNSANGGFVRKQIEEANQARHWLAISVHEGDAQRLAPATQWRASALGELVTTNAFGLVGVQARLFSAWPEGWGSWLRLNAPLAWTQPALTKGPGHEPADTLTTQLRMPLLSGAKETGEKPVRLMLLGRLARLEGGTLLSADAACHGTGCPTPGLLQALSIQPDSAAAALVLHLQPQSRFLALRPEQAQQLRVQWDPDSRGHLVPVWKSPGGSGRQVQGPADVHIAAQGGVALFEAGAVSSAAIDLGLLPLLGAGSAQSHGLIGMLQRLGTHHGVPRVEAELTIEPRYQRLLHDILACMGGAGGDWLVAESRCSERGQEVELMHPHRQSHAVVMGAETGEILATASGAKLAGATPENLHPEHPFAAQLLGFERFNPAASPLKLGSWVHHGGSAQSPGSTFKVVQSLALEQKGISQPGLRQVLEGLDIHALDAQASRSGYSFSAAAGCYPAPCPPSGKSPRQPYIENFGHPAASAARHADEERLGLVQALRNSINTWFAFAGEWADDASGMGYAGAQGLGELALSNERPVQALFALLRWEQRWPLDGGLLPADFGWQAQDVLLTSASVADPFVDRHSVRQQAIGLRLQTTPLALAGVAAAVASGHVARPRVLKGLNGERSANASGPALGMPLQRVRSGLSAVVRSGTAAKAFSAPSLKDVKFLVFGKTGSAPLGNRLANLNCKDIALRSRAPLECLNAAWFIGYLQPGSIPGEVRPLAFAVQITHTRMLGGSLAAPVMARWLEAVRAEQTRPPVGGVSTHP